MTTETKLKAQANPDLANKLAEEAMKPSEQEVATTAPKANVMLPPDTEVKLLGGLLDPFNGMIETAEVRELTGVDEELIAKLNDPGKALLTILERATLKIGDEPATKELLDAMYAGDREMILLAIRIATFGSDVKLGPGNCPDCGVEQIYEINLKDDVPLKKLDGDREFTVSCKVGEVVVTLPTGSAQKALVTSTNKTTAELDTVLLKHCIKSINGQPVLNPESVRNLSLKDRRDILEEITNRNPGPQLSEIKKSCQSCGSEVSLPLTLADLFR